MLSKADLVPYKDEVEDQIYTNSCGPHAYCNAIETVYRNAGQHLRFSRAHMWQWVRTYNNTFGLNKGADFNAVKKTLEINGVCLESTYPWEKRDYGTAPIKGDYYGFKLVRTEYGFDLISNIKRLICLGLPVIMLFRVTKDFISSNFKGDWRTHSLPPTVAEVTSLHYMCIVGYDDVANRFLLENSYGKTFGDGGFIGIEYNNFMKYLEEISHIDDYPIFPTMHEGYSPTKPYMTSGVLTGWYERAKPYLMTELQKATVGKEGNDALESAINKAKEMGLSSTMVENMFGWPSGTFLKYVKENKPLAAKDFIFDQR